MLVCVSLASGSLWSPFLSFDAAAEGFVAYWTITFKLVLFHAAVAWQTCWFKIYFRTCSVLSKKASPNVLIYTNVLSCAVTNDLGRRGGMYMLQDRFHVAAVNVQERTAISSSFE